MSRTVESWAYLLLLPLSLLMGAFFLVPIANIAWTSVYDGAFTVEAYADIFSSTLVWRVLLTTFEISLTSTIISLFLGFPIASHIARQTAGKRAFYMMLVMLPFWTSILVKSYALIILFGEKGLINVLLRYISGGWLEFNMMFNRIGVTIGMINYLLPFMVLPILASLLAQDQKLQRAAELMGAGPIRIFWRITLPLALPGVISGILLNMAISIGFYITPALLGGSRDMMLSNIVDLYTRQTLNWQTASAIAIVLLLLSGVLFAALIRVRDNEAVV